MNGALRIGIIGSGRMGGAVGLKWAHAGHRVFFSSWNPDQFIELVEDSGFEPVFVGELERAREFDRGTAVYVRGMSAAELRAALNLQLNPTSSLLGT
jgi:predicted dinucleotide-binding enzyme